jgi:hypothetical protein
MDEIRSRKGGSPASKKPARKLGRLLALAACLAVVIFAAAKSEFFSGRSAATLSAPMDESAPSDTAAVICATGTGDLEESGGLYSDSNDVGTGDDVQIMSSPSVEEETDQISETSDGQDPSLALTAAPTPSESEPSYRGAEMEAPAVNEASVSLLGFQ